MNENIIEEQEDPNVVAFNKHLARIRGDDQETEGVHYIVEKGGELKIVFDN
jgi:hypothetical protein